MSNVKDVDLPRHAWDTPPFLLIVSPTLSVQSVDAYIRTLGQSRDNQGESLTIFYSPAKNCLIPFWDLFRPMGPNQLHFKAEIIMNQ